MRTEFTDQSRLYKLNRHDCRDSGPVVYWMSRDVRFDDNWSFIFALELAGRTSRRIEVLYIFDPGRCPGTLRSFDFTARGIAELEKRAGELGITFRVFCSSVPVEAVVRYAQELEAAAVVCDFNPLREPLRQAKVLAEAFDAAVIEVDAHNIVPCRFISDRQEYGAQTLRRKIEKLLPRFLGRYPSVEEVIAQNNIIPCKSEAADFEQIKEVVQPDGFVEPVEDLSPGFKGGMMRLEEFLFDGLEAYDRLRNDPAADAQSGLSPWLHHGYVSAQTAAFAAAVRLDSAPLKGGFLDEIIVRRELSDNFCLYNPHYDSASGFPAWAEASLSIHRFDKREYLYSFEEFDLARTHDPLWNAAQLQLINRGRMHGYMRMYWAKKILEWSCSADEAMRSAVRLNDRYSLDGCDPNGYAGCAWAVGGVHDRAWPERAVFGKIRYMNYNGCRRKFDIEKYIASVSDV